VDATTRYAFTTANIEWTPQQMVQSRKLRLVVDLDDTIVTTSRVPVTHVVDAACEVAHPLEFDEKHQTQCVSTVRPGTREVLQFLSNFYLIDIATMGIARYAATILDYIDPGRKFITGRVVTRSDWPDQKTKSLRHVCGSEFRPIAVILDDTIDVWHETDRRCILPVLPPDTNKRDNIMFGILCRLIQIHGAVFSSEQPPLADVASYINVLRSRMFEGVRAVVVTETDEVGDMMMSYLMGHAAAHVVLTTIDSISEVVDGTTTHIIVHNDSDKRKENLISLGRLLGKYEHIHLVSSRWVLASWAFSERRREDDYILSNPECVAFNSELVGIPDILCIKRLPVTPVRGKRRRSV
jgi:hypothetical protein